MNREYDTITKQTPRELNFEIYNQLICSNTDFELSQRNLIMMYSYLFIFIQQNLIDNLNTFLNKTTYFNKIIFLKYLLFFGKLNQLQNKFLAEKSKIQAENEAENEAKIQAIETENTKVENFKKHFLSNTINLLINNRYIYSSDLATLLTTDTGSIESILEGIDNIITTLFDADTIRNIYKTVIKNIDDNIDDSSAAEEYRILFHLNPINNNSVSSNKAMFFIGFHGTLFTVIPNNQYLTIQTPVNTTINRWGIRGDPTKFFNSMKYTFKQCLLLQGENLDNFNANSCFELLGTSIKDFNYDTSQTTTAYCETEPNNFFYNLIGFKKNKKMRIKHYSTDSYYFGIFNTDYTISDAVFSNLSLKIPRTLDKTLQYNTAENIINLNFLLFTYNINFTVFNFLNIKDKTGFDTFNLYPTIGLYTKIYNQYREKNIQSHLHDLYFPLDIFSFKTNLFIEDFVLERDIFALNNITIHLTYQNIDRSFMLFKGDSFSSNPYIIEYFIKTFNSKITIRPGPILGNKADSMFEDNKKEGTTREKGATITCLTKGLSCYKVTLSVLTNYEILKFCKDANINTCDLYDTSCQSFQYINDVGKIYSGYTPSPPQKQTLQRMSTYDDTNMLPKYDNLSDLLFNYMIKKPNFLVLGVDLKRKRGGRTTKKRINNKKNSYKQRKNSYKQRKNSRKQRKNTCKENLSSV
jgi:hypothetical protein